MAEQSKASVPSTIGGSFNGGGNNTNNNANGIDGDDKQGRHGNGRCGRGNRGGHKKPDVLDNTAPIRRAFKDDDPNILGAMHQHYFDCYDITLKKLQQYVTENCKTFGRKISLRITDLSSQPTVPMVEMPQKFDTATNTMVDKQRGELSYPEQKILEERFKMFIQLEHTLKEELGVLYGFIFCCCTTMLQDRLQARPQMLQRHP
jgi:hypothetical protein